MLNVPLDRTFEKNVLSSLLIKYQVYLPASGLILSIESYFKTPSLYISISYKLLLIRPLNISL